MNKEWLVFQLREALGGIEHALKQIECDAEYEDERLRVDMTHIYHHLNTAWNSRNAEGDLAWKCSEDEFYGRRQFPSDLSMAKDGLSR